MGRNLIIFDNNYETGRLIADSFKNKALTAKHTASLQLLCTVGGDLASPRTKAKSTFFFLNERCENFKFGTRIQSRLTATNCT